MRYVVIDTETTGLPDWHQPSELPHQHRIMELAALLYDDKRLIEAHCWLISPSKWPEPEAEALATHGITVAECEQDGQPWSVVWPAFCRLMEAADKIVMFGASFDRRMVRIELKQRKHEGAAEWFKARPYDCVMQQATKALGLAPSEAMSRAGRHYSKTANLGEAFEHFMGRPFGQSHRALFDAIACARVYQAMNLPKPSDTAPKPLL